MSFDVSTVLPVVLLVAYPLQTGALILSTTGMCLSSALLVLLYVCSPSSLSFSTAISSTVLRQLIPSFCLFGYLLLRVNTL